MNSVSTVVLLVGTLIGAVEVALIGRACWEYLRRAYPDPTSAARVAAMIAGMAVALLFGVILLIATLGVEGLSVGTPAGLSATLARVGVLFFLVAAVHTLVLVVLCRDLRQEREIAATEQQLVAGPRPDTTRR